MIIILSKITDDDLVPALVHELAHIFLDSTDEEASTFEYRAYELLYGKMSCSLGEFLKFRKSLSSLHRKTWNKRPSERGFPYLEIVKGECRTPVKNSGLLGQLVIELIHA